MLHVTDERTTAPVGDRYEPVINNATLVRRHTENVG
jgi:hypothetical protein